MAQISLRFVVGGVSTIGTATISDANAGRILTAERKNMSRSNDQETVQALTIRFVDDMIADTKTVEREALSVGGIDVT